jgi:hypothetical protein
MSLDMPLIKDKRIPRLLILTNNNASLYKATVIISGEYETILINYSDKLLVKCVLTEQKLRFLFNIEIAILVTSNSYKPMIDALKGQRPDGRGGPEGGSHQDRSRVKGFYMLHHYVQSIQHLSGVIEIDAFDLFKMLSRRIERVEKSNVSFDRQK